MSKENLALIHISKLTAVAYFSAVCTGVLTALVLGIALGIGLIYEPDLVHRFIASIRDL